MISALEEGGIEAETIREVLRLDHGGLEGSPDFEKAREVLSTDY